jgi:hypothetical protein
MYVRWLIVLHESVDGLGVNKLRLRKAIKSFYESSFNRTLDVESEIQVTSGANEGIITFRILPLCLTRSIAGMYAAWAAFLEEVCFSFIWISTAGLIYA